jgi:hypothetical protein
MANHCVNTNCIICGGEFCMRGCGYNYCRCGHSLDKDDKKFYSEEEIDRLINEYHRNISKEKSNG